MNSTIKRSLGRRAAKATVKHSAHGVAAKARRKPLRSTTLLSAGLVLGGAAGWFARRKSA